MAERTQAGNSSLEKVFRWEKLDLISWINLFTYNDWQEIITVEQKTDEITLQRRSKGNSRYHMKFSSIIAEVESGTDHAINSTQNRTTSEVCFVHVKSVYDGATDHSDWTKNVDEQDLFPYWHILAAFQLSIYYRNLLAQGQKMNQVLRLEIAVKRLILIILKKKLQGLMRQDLVWLKERNESRLQDREKKWSCPQWQMMQKKLKWKDLGFILKNLYWDGG